MKFFRCFVLKPLLTQTHKSGVGLMLAKLWKCETTTVYLLHESLNLLKLNGIRKNVQGNVIPGLFWRPSAQCKK